MKITYLGHSAFIIETQGKRLVVDPFISPNPLAQRALQQHPDWQELLDPQKIQVDYILLTHGHQDHMADAETIGIKNDATLISSFELVTWFAEKGLKGHPLNHGGKATMPFGTLKYVNAIHSSSLPDGSYAGNPGGFVLWNEEGCLYIAGDTALTQDMKLIPLTCPKLTAAILPIGDNFTMGYEEAVIASDFIECPQIIGCHYDTFGYIEIDHEAAKKAFQGKGKTLHLLSIGQEHSL
mgnify:CR=1 FL=1